MLVLFLSVVHHVCGEPRSRGVLSLTNHNGRSFRCTFWSVLQEAPLRRTLQYGEQIAVANLVVHGEQAVHASLPRSVTANRNVLREGIAGLVYVQPGLHVITCWRPAVLETSTRSHCPNHAVTCTAHRFSEDTCAPLRAVQDGGTNELRTFRSRLLLVPPYPELAGRDLLTGLGNLDRDQSAINEVHFFGEGIAFIVEDELQYRDRHSESVLDKDGVHEVHRGWNAAALNVESAIRDILNVKCCFHFKYSQLPQMRVRRRVCLREPR
ncbi:hypothetical protein D3C71_1325010 [compost metagenome]